MTTRAVDTDNAVRAEDAPHTPLVALVAARQSIWLDYITRDLVRGGALKRLIEQDGIRGMTSNPTIFQKAIASGSAHDEQIDELLLQGKDTGAVFEALAICDIRDAWTSSARSMTRPAARTVLSRSRSHRASRMIRRGRSTRRGGCGRRWTVRAPPHGLSHAKRERRPFDEDTMVTAHGTTTGADPALAVIRPERRLGFAAWMVLLSGLTLLLLSATQSAYRIGLPTDGWSFTSGAIGGPLEDHIIYAANEIGAPSPLQSGDRVLAVEGHAFETLLAHAATREPPLVTDWHAGRTVRYQVQRGEAAIALEVPLSHWRSGLA